MNGQLSEQPLVELIREISAESLAGRLQLQRDRVKVVVYFDNGEVLYAASNLRTLRLREYLLKGGMAGEALTLYDDRQPDLELAKRLCADHLLTPASTEQVQMRQVTDVLRLALSWTEGTWKFDPRSHLDAAPKLNLDTRALILEAARRLPPKFVASRFQNPAELISPVPTSVVIENLQPAEGFLLSRVDRPTSMKELVDISGLSENETLVHLYTLSLAGLLRREDAKSVLGRPAATVEPAPEQPAPTSALPVEEKTVDEPDDVESFLAKISSAQTHYDVLGVDRESSPEEMKTRYYELARRYHPDRFRKAESTMLTRLESAFARVTQAYDNLRDDRLRANYNAKLEARQKAQQVANTAPKPTAPVQPVATTTTNTDTPSEREVSIAERAELQFKEGFAALELGQRKVAIGLLAAAANAVPKEARYRAFYGKVLAAQPNTRRAAEAELQAAIKLDPQNGEYRVMLAELYRDLGLMLRARGEAERAIASDPNNSKARDLLRTLKSV
ncbi:MAG TPA: DUF4388 domain-containing protein [Pyrinomonadaceae bacterium]|nr:DUF4388 domain-containing protein [Pyrinomonadaceae bacterium]